MTAILLPLILCCLLSALATWALVAILNRTRSFVAVKPELLVKDERKGRTPFFGGLAFLFAITLTCAFFCDWSEPETWIPVCSMWIFGLSGLADDLLKLRTDNGDGFTVRQKFASQVISALIVICLIQAFAHRYDSYLYMIPGFVWLVYYVNAYNITDGVDALASCSVIPVLVLLALTGQQTMAVITAGCMAGFLFFNSSPARIFMGDVGSHAVAGLIAAMAVLGKTEIPVFCSSLLFFVEFMSSLIQILSIRLLGKKVFAIAPLHHLMEYKGFGPWKIVIIFSAVNILATIAVCLLWGFV